MQMNNWLAEYRDAGARLDRHGMNHRSHEKTEIINRLIIDRFEWTAEMDVADIGCGDGFLLAHLPPVRSRVGVVPSGEEVVALNQFHPVGITFLRGLASNIPLPDASCDVVICNGVLLLLGAQEVWASVAELRRIVKNGGTVFIGEVPAPISVTLRTIVRALRTLHKPMAPKLFTSAPASFISLCEATGFVVLEHDELSVAGKQPRYNYVLTTQQSGFPPAANRQPS